MTKQVDISTDDVLTNEVYASSAKTLLLRLLEEKAKLNSKVDFSAEAKSIGNNIKKIPFQIPKTWIWTSLKDISIIQEGPGIRKNQYRRSGIQFLTVTNILEGSIDLEKSKKYISDDEYNGKYRHFTLNRGDIVSSCSGATWGKTAIFDLENRLILNTSTLRLRFFGDLGEKKYLYYLTKWNFFKKQILAQLSGQQPNFGYSHYSVIQIPLAPLYDQKHIVAIIEEAFDALDKAILNTKKNLQNAKDLFDSYLQNIFENNNGAWEVSTLEDILEKTETIDPTRESNKEFTYLDVSSVNKENLQIENPVQILGKDAPSRARKLIKTNDIIFATVRPTLGRVAIITEDYHDQVCSTGYFVLRAKRAIHYKLIFYYLLTRGFNSQMEKLQKGASYPAVNDSEVKQQIISYPGSHSEQKEIVKRLDELYIKTKKLEGIYQQKIAAMEEFKKSILQKAFSGELKTKNKELVA